MRVCEVAHAGLCHVYTDMHSGFSRCVCRVYIHAMGLCTHRGVCVCMQGHTCRIYTCAVTYVGGVCIYAEVGTQVYV